MKKIWSLVLVMILAFSCTISAMAAELDPQVQAAYDAYKDVAAAFVACDYDTMKAAFENYNMIIDEFTDEQSDELNEIFDANDETDDALVNLICAATVIYTVDLADEYVNNQNAKTAYEFVYAYEGCKEAEIEIDNFNEGIKKHYEKALDSLPSDNVLAVYEAYESLEMALWWGIYDEDFTAVCDEFEAVLDVLNELTSAEWEDMALFMEVENGEVAFSQVLTDWINANTILTMGEAYDAFCQNPDSETAASLVEVYESVFEATDFYTEEEFEMFREFFLDIDEVYEEAKALVGANDQSKEDEKEEIEKIEDTNKSDPDKNAVPKTGDDANMILYASLMLMAGAVLTVRRKRA